MHPRSVFRALGPRFVVPALALVLAGPALAEPPQDAIAPDAPALEGPEAEEFLRTARVIARKPIGEGVTRSDKLTLSDGKRTARAAFKTINKREMGLTRMADGRVEWDFRDSWKNDVAAYELDKLLGLGLVPPTVERRIDGRVGALQLWIEDAFDEKARRERRLTPPDLEQWKRQRAAVRLLRELARDPDYNIQNTIYGPGFRVYAIDFSRGFRIDRGLLSPETVDRFSRRVLDRLRALDPEVCEQRLRPWLDRMQIEGLLSRRERILAFAETRVAGGADLVP